MAYDCQPKIGIVERSTHCFGRIPWRSLDGSMVVRSLARSSMTTCSSYRTQSFLIAHDTHPELSSVFPRLWELAGTGDGIGRGVAAFG